MRVLVADDHPLFRDGIVSLLEAAGFEVVGQVGDGASAVEAAERLSPDLILMDVTMPKLNGIQALSKIKEKKPEVEVVMLTVSDDDEDLSAAAQAGASGYLLKSLDSDEFLSLLEGIKAGEAPLTRRTAARLLRLMSGSASDSRSSATYLTARELELLGLVADGLPNKAIAQELSISENTVKYHMKNILSKLDVHNRTEAVAQAIRAGLIAPQSKSFPD